MSPHRFHRIAPALPLALLLALLITAPAALAQSETRDDGKPSGIRLRLPGPLVGATVLPTPGATGRSTLALVIADAAPETESPEGDAPAPPRRLYRYDLATRTFAPWTRSELPDGALRLASRTDDGPWLGRIRFGGLDLLSAARPNAEPAFRFDLPRRAARTSWGLRLTSPGALPTGRAGTPEVPPCFATEPEAHGPRLRVLLLCPGREPEETWALLPGKETVTETRFGLLEGAPALAVLTRTKLGLFVKQDLRVFALSGSRSRLGTGPILAESTDCPIWRGLDLAFADADGDGREDVVLVCEKGLVDPELRIELHRASGPAGGGGFDPPRVTELEGEYDSWSYRDDWTGDGLADLVVLRDDRIELHPGARGRRPVDRSPAWAVSLPAREGGEEAEEDGTSVQLGAEDGAQVRRWEGSDRILTTADLDGDGRPEVVVHRAAGADGAGGELIILRR